MRNFEYVRALAQADALASVAGRRDARFLAGGTTIVDLMKCGVEDPGVLVDITWLPGLDRIEADDRGLRIGALARMSEVADHPGVKRDYPAISQALTRGASQQLRNMATIGGNLMQRTRCAYFRDPAAYPACNKRAPGSGCAALHGINRGHAVLGGSARCIATHPGDLAVALVAFDAVVHIENGGSRSVAADAFFLPPGETPHIEFAIAPGEMIVGLEIPASPAMRRSAYLKVRDRESYEFAAASAAVGLELEDDGVTVRDVRVALGGVATRPWRARLVEAELTGKAFEAARVRRASRLAVEGAIGQGLNNFKIELAPRVVARALLSLWEAR